MCGALFGVSLIPNSAGYSSIRMVASRFRSFNMYGTCQSGRASREILRLCGQPLLIHPFKFTNKQSNFILNLNAWVCPSQWPHDLKRGSTSAACWDNEIRIPSGASVLCFVRERRTDHTSGGALPSVVCLDVIEETRGGGSRDLES